MPWEAPAQRQLILPLKNGKQWVFQPAKRVETKVLQAQCGDPDEMHKCFDPTQNGPEAAKNAPPWKVWIWGKTIVLVDDNATTRYICTGDSDSQSTPRRGEAGKEAQPKPTGKPFEQLAKLLAADGSGTDAPLHVKLPNGHERVFRPTKHVAAKVLQSQCGAPDEVRKRRDPTKTEEEAKNAPSWEIWVWGKTQILVDDSGTTRYISASGKKNPSQQSTDEDRRGAYKQRPDDDPTPLTRANGAERVKADSQNHQGDAPREETSASSVAQRSTAGSEQS